MAGFRRRAVAFQRAGIPLGCAPGWLPGRYLRAPLRPVLLRRHRSVPAFTRFAEQAPRIYSFDILGAGRGQPCRDRRAPRFPPMTALKLVGAAGIAAALLARCTARGNVDGIAWGLLRARAGCSRFLELGSRWRHLRTRIYRRCCRIDGSGSSRSGRVPSDSSRWSKAPRPLSACARPEPERARGSRPCNSASSPTATASAPSIASTAERASIAYLDWLPSALPYHLLREPSVLVLGSGAGSDVLQAWYHAARAITAVELNPDVVTWSSGLRRILRCGPMRSPRERARGRGARIRRGATRGTT